MNRHEAITCLKEITISTNMTADSITLFDSKPDDAQSTGYQLHIRTLLDTETKQRLQSIAEKQSLALREENGLVIIYKPKSC